MGGSDQWGNIVNGVDLGRRMGTPQLFALTTPLLTTASGAKMGKTAQGRGVAQRRPVLALRFLAVLAQHRGRRRRADSSSCSRSCRWARSRKLAALQGAEINEAKKVLATEATALLHGRDAAKQAAETARQTFEEGALAENLPTVEIPRGELDGGARRARRLRQGGPGRLQRRGAAPDQGRRPARQRRRRHRREDDADAGQPHAEGVIKLSLGKKRHVLLRPA